MNTIRQGEGFTRGLFGDPANVPVPNPATSVYSQAELLQYSCTFQRVYKRLDYMRSHNLSGAAFCPLEFPI